MDAMVTGLILGGVVASIYGIKRTEKQKEEDFKKIQDGYYSTREIIKMLVFGVKKEKKKSFLEKILRK